VNWCLEGNLELSKKAKDLADRINADRLKLSAYRVGDDSSDSEWEKGRVVGFRPYLSHLPSPSPRRTRTSLTVGDNMQLDDDKSPRRSSSRLEPSRLAPFSMTFNPLSTEGSCWQTS
jgi:hypothetical protein